MKQPRKRELELLEKWRGTPIGTAVTLRRDSGEVVLTKTRSAPQILSGHTAVIWLEGVTGCYALDRVDLATSVTLDVVGERDASE